jgi:chromosome segregation ATPase
MMEVRRYKVAKGMDQAYDAAYSRVREDWEENGAEWFSENFIEDYAEVDYDWVDAEAETRAIDDSANVGDEEDMREELGVTSEYNDYKDEIDYTKVEIVKVLTQIEEAEFKRDEIEKEKILLEKEIERLGGDIEYEEDNPNYTEFSDEIERLQIKMNQMEGWFEETKTIIELLYQDHRNLEEDIKEMESEMEKYEGEKLIDDYVVSRTEHWKNEIEDDPLQYLNEWLDMSLAYAIDEGYMVVDEDELIRGAIHTDGEAHFLAPYDGDENSEEVDGVDYIMYRTD